MNFSKLNLFSYKLCLLLLFGNIAFAGNSVNKQLVYADKIYENQIKSAYLFRGDNSEASPIFPPAVPLSQTIPLTLTFDELFTDNAAYYKARIIRCDMMWQPSSLSEMQYLYEYNEFSIDEFDFSIATKIPYTNFIFQLPKVKLPGNYLLVVYREGNKDDIIITKQYIVYDQRVSVLGEIALSNGVSRRKTSQQILFSVDYSNFPIPNPYLDVHAVIKQNQRWDNAIYNLQPSIIKEDISQIEYRNFNFENNFLAGNEFRFFDIRTIHYGGRNVERTDISETSVDAWLYIDKSREKAPYMLNSDLNGGYIIENSEGRDNLLESEYINVHFFLELEKPIPENIYIGGKLVNWNFNNANKMIYNDVSGLYMCDILLKQGLYDFGYFIPQNEDNPNLIEGNHFETRNEYEIIIYYRDQLLNTDVIVGYLNLN